MFDVVTYALVKKLIGQAAAGITNIEFSNGELIFYLPDNSTIKVPIPLAAGVVGAEVDENNNLTILFDDNTSLTYSAPTKEELKLVEEKVGSLEIKQTNLEAAQNKLLEDFENLGLSVQEGLLCITYEQGE